MASAAGAGLVAPERREQVDHAAAHGERYAPSAFLRDRAEKNERFFEE